MNARTTVFCSACGVENPIEALFCSACGAKMGTATTAPEPTSAAAPAVVREGIVATGVQRVAYAVAAICGLAAFVVTVLAFGSGGLAWATRESGFLEIAGPAPGYVGGVLLIVVLNAFLLRRLVPRRRDVGAAVLRRYRRTLRERDGIRFLLVPGGLRAGIVIISLLWIGIGGIALYNLAQVGDNGWEAGTGLYLSMVIPVIGLISTACVWPFAAETVYMDRQGVITRG